MIIIAVLGVIGLLLIMNLQLCSDTLYATRYLTTLQNREASYYLARSVYLSSLKVLQLSDLKKQNDCDSLKDIWAQDMPEIEINEGTIKLRIEDENRRFNLNSLLDKDLNVESKHVTQLQRLLELLEMNPNFANAVADWLDKDQNPTLPGGSETMQNSERPSRNARMDAVEELTYINGFNDAWLHGEVTKSSYKPGLKDLLTACSGEKININTAGSMVLQSLDPAITEQMAQEIITRRADKAFTGMDGLLAIPGFTTDIIYKAKYLADVKSTHYRIMVDVKRATDQTKLTVVVEKGKEGLKPLFWKVE
jgi:general secretion pathway protein K